MYVQYVCAEICVYILCARGECAMTICEFCVCFAHSLMWRALCVTWLTVSVRAFLRGVYCVCACCVSAV